MATVFSVARTRDEAHLYLDPHPCEECGSIDMTWENALANFVVVRDTYRDLAGGQQ